MPNGCDHRGALADGATTSSARYLRRLATLGEGRAQLFDSDVGTLPEDRADQPALPLDATKAAVAAENAGPGGALLRDRRASG